MPAQTTEADVGVKQLGNGTLLTHRGRACNELADKHAKEAAGLVRVPESTREQVNNYLANTKEVARWIGEITHTANHRDELPHPDSVASKAVAAIAKIGRAKTNAPRVRPMIVARLRR